MKRFAALLLVVCLLTAMVPAVRAAQRAPEARVQTADLLEAVNESYQAPEKGEDLNWIVPMFDMYGMTVVKDEEMVLSCMIDDGSRYTVNTGFMVFKGTLDELTDASLPVAHNYFPTENSSEYVEKFYWDTKGAECGDYTAIFYLTPDEDESQVLYASACDVYISDREIPLDHLELCVLELGKVTEAVRVRAGVNQQMSVVAVRYPYHTTDRRRVVMSGYDGEFTYGRANFPFAESINAPSEAGEYRIQGWIYDKNFKAEHITELKVIVEEDVGQFPTITALDGGVICFGQEKGFRIDMPSGSTIDDAIIQVTADGLVEISRVEENVIYLKGVRVDSSYQELCVALGERFVTRSFESQNHSDYAKYETKPTCTEVGVRSHYCEDCGLIWYEEVEAKGHKIKKGAEIVVIEEPKATKRGISGGECERCGELATFETGCIFTDTQPDRFYSDALDYCYEKGIISGMTATTFGPTGTLNRAQLVSMLYRHAGSPAAEGENTFTDVPAESFYTAAVIWASENGIVYGYEDGSFRPGNSITRQELVAMLHRYVARLDKDNGERSDLAAFEDLDQLMGYAEDAMQWAVANGVISGISETQLGPRQSANRAQTVTILHRIITGILGE